MTDGLELKVIATLESPGYRPLKPKALARRLEIDDEGYAEFRQTLKALARRGRLELDKRHCVRIAVPPDHVVGVYRPTRSGGGFVRPRKAQGSLTTDVFIRADAALDAAAGDLVAVHLGRPSRTPGRLPSGRIVEVLERAAKQFVGVYRTSHGEGFVRVDGGLFGESIYVGDAGAKGARDGDKVVFEMLRFPSPQVFGEGVLVDVLGPRGAPGVDLLSIIRQFNLPDEFAEEALAEAREQARRHQEDFCPPDRLDLTEEQIITIDPVDARDFDDAVSLSRDAKGGWRLGVHIADVAAFVPAGSALDLEARSRGTSVYLPGRVLPMLPELISNGLASLQQDRLRLTKSVFIEFTSDGIATDVSFANSAIRAAKRFAYEEVSAVFDEWDGKTDAGGATAGVEPSILELLQRLRALASLLRKRRRGRGFLELSLPAPVLTYDADGKVSGAKYVPGDESHRLSEEFMLTANEAVARHLADQGAAFLRRIHETPDPEKLKSFAEFLRSLGIEIEDEHSRFALQRIVKAAEETPQRHAVNYSLLRSLKQAVYGPEEEGHWAVASDCYCHFTSPIRRYPDLVVHRQLDRWLRTGKAGHDDGDLSSLGEHCSFTERRAEKAERELLKIKILTWLQDRVGEQMDMIVTAVEEYGFYAQGIDFPAEGLVHIRSLTDDFYVCDSEVHSLTGRAKGRSFRLGDPVRCVIHRVDLEHRQLDLRVVGMEGRPDDGSHGVPASMFTLATPRLGRKRAVKSSNTAGKAKAAKKVKIKKKKKR
ncbi:MAG: ribonuclease R family protein [Planctomycetia bacterium]